MFAYKGFNKDLTCRGYQFKENEWNITESAKCVNSGFHCASDPLDCLTYYPSTGSSTYYIVEIAGDIHEDGSDTKISCTEMRLVKELTPEKLVAHALAYIIKHPIRSNSHHVKKDIADASKGVVVVRGKTPMAMGKKGSAIGLAQEYKNNREIKQVIVITIDGKKYKENTYYDITGKEILDGKIKV